MSSFRCAAALFRSIVFAMVMASCASDAASPASGTDCASSNECRADGLCEASSDGTCVATRDEHCKQATNACVDLGRCTASDGACIATSAQDCNNSRSCPKYGLCSLVGEACEAATKEDCHNSEFCQLWSKCNLNLGQCTDTGPH